VVGFLSVDGDVTDTSAVFFDEFFRLNKHTAGTATGVIDAAFIRGEHFDKNANDATRRVELAAFLALGAGKLRKEIFIHTAKYIFRTVFSIAQADVPDEVNELAEALFVETRVRVVFRKNAFKRRIVPFDGEHGVINCLADGRLLGASFKM